MSKDRIQSEKVMELNERLHDIQADYIDNLNKLFSLLDKDSTMREFELTSRGLSEEDVSVLKALPSSCLKDLPIVFELDTGPLKKLNQFIKDNGLKHDSLPPEISVLIESLQAERTKTLEKNKRF